MNWLAMIFVIELGLSPIQGTMISFENTKELYATEMTYYVDMEAEARLWDFIFIGGVIKTEMILAKDMISFRPEVSSYLFNAGVRFDFLEIGFRHMCVHPTMPYYLNFEPIQTYDGFYEEFYIRISNDF